MSLFPRVSCNSKALFAFLLEFKIGLWYFGTNWGDCGMKFFVTGATGFVGSWVVDTILSQFPDAEITCLVRPTSNLQWLEGKPIRLYQGSLLDEKSLAEALRDAEYILHIAGVVKALNPEGYYLGNVRTCEVLYQAAHRWARKVKQIVHLSSQAVVGPSPGPEPLFEEAPPNPLTDYGKSKWQGEQVAHRWLEHLPIVILRPSAVYGPRDKEIFRVFQNVWYGWNVKVGIVDPVVSLIYVSDLARAIIQAALSPAATGQTYFVCDDHPYVWSQVAEKLANIMQRRVRTLSVPLPVAYLVASAMEWWGTLRQQPTMLNRQKMAELKQAYWVISNQKIRKDLQFKPLVSLEEGLRRTYNWYREQGWLR